MNLAKPNIGLIGLIGEEVKKDLWGTLQKVADIGYKGVEGAEYLLQGDVEANVKRLHELGLQVLTHSASREQLESDLDKVIADAHRLKAPRVTVWWAPCASKEEVLTDADLYNQAGAKLAAEGLKLCYHNHAHEFYNVFDGVNALDLLAVHTDPKYVYFELDVAWIALGGADPVHILKKMAGRVPAIHIKDVYGFDEIGKWTAVGTGVVNIEDAILTAEQLGIEWMVVEQDQLRHLTAIETITVSYLNLKEKGLINL